MEGDRDGRKKRRRGRKNEQSRRKKRQCGGKRRRKRRTRTKRSIGGVVEVTGQEAARPLVMSSRSLEDLEGEVCPLPSLLSTIALATIGSEV